MPATPKEDITNPLKLIEPVCMFHEMWPQYNLYSHQREILYSTRDNKETFVTACNQSGKDFIAAGASVIHFIAAKRFGLSCRIITTSVKDDHLRVLWGEIGRMVRTAATPLLYHEGGPLVFNHREIRWAPEGRLDEVSYLRGMVSEKGEGLTGHHADWTLLIGDEASGLDEQVYDQGRTWSKRRLFIGNPNPCTNFFRVAVKGGDMELDASAAEEVIKKINRSKMT